ncbi:MAG: hypothetical protein QM608_20705 [Caulobacter sp.]
MVPAMGVTPFYQVALIGLLVGLFGSPMIVLGWWLNRSWGRGGGAFAAFVAGPPTLLLLVFEAYWIVSAALEPPMNITPFPANAWDYPPNWIMLIGTAASYLFAALVYTTLAQAKRSSKAR